MSALEKPPYSDEFYEVMLENESTLQNEFGITDVKVCHLKNSSLVLIFRLMCIGKLLVKEGHLKGH